MEKSQPLCDSVFPLFALPEATVPESLLLMTIRLWRKSRTTKPEMLPDWRGGLCAIGLSHITEDIVEPLFGSVFYSSKASDGGSLHACTLAREELLLINAIGAIQHRKVERVRRWLADFLFPATARVILPLLTRMAAALEFRGLVLPDRTGGAGAAAGAIGKIH